MDNTTQHVIELRNEFGKDTAELILMAEVIEELKQMNDNLENIYYLQGGE